MFALNGFPEETPPQPPILDHQASSISIGGSAPFSQQHSQPLQQQHSTSLYHHGLGAGNHLQQPPQHHQYDSSMTQDGQSPASLGGLSANTYSSMDYDYNAMNHYNVHGHQQSGGYGHMDMTGYSSSMPQSSPPTMVQSNGYYSSHPLYDQGEHHTIYQQDTATGPDNAGAPGVSHVTPPVPVPQMHHPPLVKTVSSGAGPTYIPDGTLDIYGGVYRVVPVRTRLFSSYHWAIDGFSQSVDEKLVSLPFGPPNWRWQLVVYPRGAGDGAGSHISAFIRPLKNETELAAGDIWTRPITEFSVRVRRAIPGSPIVGVPDPIENYITTDTSAPSFTGFSAAMSGWGFPELLELQSLSDAVTYDGTLNLEADVIGEQVLDWAVYQYQWDIPSFRQLTEDETQSQAFGPPECQWRIQIFRQGNKEGQGTHFSVYLIPEKSAQESALKSAWSRPIVSLTIKVHAAGEALVTKTLTGGYIFDAENPACGWPQLVELSQLNDSIDWYGTLSIQTEVTWELSYGGPGTDLGRVRSTLAEISGELDAIKGRAEALSEELDQARAEVVNLRTELAASHSELSSTRTQLNTSQSQLEDVESRLRTVGNIEARMAVVQKELVDAQKRVEEAERIEERFVMVKTELAAARDAQQISDELRVKIAKFKAKIAALRAGMEDEGVLSVPQTSGDGKGWNGEGEQDALRTGEDDADTLHLKLVQVNAKVAALEADLAEARAEIDAKTRALADAAINAPTTEEEVFDEEGNENPLLAAMATVRNEVLVVKGVLLEASGRELETDAERAGLSAELAMVQAELEVTRAALIDAASKSEELESDTETAAELARIQADLQDVRTQLITRRLGLEDTADLANAIVTYRADTEDRATSPLRSHGFSGAPSPQHSAADYGLTSISTLDSEEAVPLPTGMPPPPINMGPPLSTMQTGPSTTDVRALQERADMLESIHHQAQTDLSYTQSELTAVQTELSDIKGRMQAAQEMLIGGASSNTGVDNQALFERLFNRRMSNALPPGDGNLGFRDIPEPWTPVEGDAAGVNSKELAALLQQVQGKSRILPSLATLMTALLTMWFIVYSTIYVVCSPSRLDTQPAPPYADVCRTTVMPAWEAVTTTWHAAAERFVGDVAPGVFDAAYTVGVWGSDVGKGVVGGLRKGVRKIKKGTKSVESRDLGSRTEMQSTVATPLVPVAQESRTVTPSTSLVSVVEQASENRTETLSTVATPVVSVVPKNRTGDPSTSSVAVVEQSQPVVPSPETTWESVPLSEQGSPSFSKSLVGSYTPEQDIAMSAGEANMTMEPVAEKLTDLPVPVADIGLSSPASEQVIHPIEPVAEQSPDVTSLTSPVPTESSPLPPDTQNSLPQKTPTILTPTSEVDATIAVSDVSHSEETNPIDSDLFFESPVPEQPLESVNQKIPISTDPVVVQAEETTEPMAVTPLVEPSWTETEPTTAALAVENETGMSPAGENTMSKNGREPDAEITPTVGDEREGDSIGGETLSNKEGREVHDSVDWAESGDNEPADTRTVTHDEL
ncbi:uncharacterized protein SPPG_06025 [Spizellomyces punctatus DAOM BR117]|uniref:MATH domain-containing protein n=1 Tax=Spizellomyces punctatus (strain DAOM BR117) TaxID=645134 RepID=A0A0L0HEB8_SPIPD|nr:uncharacterized protein SPPG_06025 [Spizellomyces punctatus DAOM BR117]KNC99078.1 hypothetical protein SPPG_06025 [Spizellomyces punctatus DAOM BR117]|eukprot:XP_016607118.1 hypothetical protein SPPG_06025 [Spizellomyces punctatus DAOM BR117]